MLCCAGYGVFTTQAFCKGDFLLDYHGQLLHAADVTRTLKDYLYFFQVGKQYYW